jgi:hypothetical protein
MTLKGPFHFGASLPIFSLFLVAFMFLRTKSLNLSILFLTLALWIMALVL